MRFVPSDPMQLHDPNPRRSLDGSRSQPCCPACGRELQRIQRRWIDRLVAPFLLDRRYRFRCEYVGCHWEGNLLTAGSSRGGARNRYDSGRELLEPSRMGQRDAGGVPRR
jgi:hypothetical protein